MAKIKVNRVLIDPKFVGDVCRRCDRWMEVMIFHHGVVTDFIEGAYADYKGGCAKLTFDSDATEIDRSICSDCFRFLLDAAFILLDLGLTLHFGSDGKHSVHCHAVEVLVDEDDI